MQRQRLQVVAVIPDEQNTNKTRAKSAELYRQEAQAKYERIWHVQPDKFNPEKDAIGRERMRRTLTLIQKHMDVNGKRAADLGCGNGCFACSLQKAGAVIDAVDIASQPLKMLKDQGLDRIHTLQDYVPHTRLNDNAYDLVVANELIAEIPQEEHRLFFSEIARLMKNDGMCVCSTELDIYSLDAFERFLKLVKTELEVVDAHFSTHYLWIKLGNVLDAPAKLAKGWQDGYFREKELQEKSGFNRFWFLMNSSRYLGWFWKGISWITNPMKGVIEQQRWLLLGLEKLSSFFWQEQAISHVILLAKRKPLIQSVDVRVVPQERQQKRRVWE